MHWRFSHGPVSVSMSAQTGALMTDRNSSLAARFRGFLPVVVDVETG